MQCHGLIENVHQKVIEGELWEEAPHQVPVCIECHQPHGNEDAQLLLTRSSQLCAGCHESAHRVSHPIGEEVIDPRTGESVTCLSCHQLHGAEFAKYLPLNPDMALCIQCHDK